MIAYIITIHPHLPGVGLSRPGWWGNLRHDDDAAAVEAARIDARGVPVDIRRETAGQRNKRR